MNTFLTSNDKTKCCGCRGCQQICPTECIHMESDSEGFIYPIMDEDKCIKCGMCIKVCPIEEQVYDEEFEQRTPKVFASYNNNFEILKRSTSGGVNSAILEAYCDYNYVIFGASFDSKLNLCHSYVTNIEESIRFRGSKYVQSDLSNSFSQVAKFLKEGRKVVFTGTPCQVDGLKRYVGQPNDKLLLIDFICHGVPSPKLFEAYKEQLEEKHSGKIVKFNFRDKDVKNWNRPYVSIEFDNGKIITEYYNDNHYIIAYDKGLSIRPICFACPYAKLPRVSDITLGDFWGIEEFQPQFYNKQGTSLVLLNTLKGELIFESSIEKLNVVEETIDNAKRYNSQLYTPSKTGINRDKFMLDFNLHDFQFVTIKYLQRKQIIQRVISILVSKKIKRKIKGIIKYSRK